MRHTEHLESPEHVRPIKRVFIANRGEIALRAMQTFEKRGIEAVLPITLSEQTNLPARIVREKYDAGWDLYLLHGVTQEETFANPKAMLGGAINMGCDAIFLGYGFLSEDAQFATMVEEENSMRRARGETPIRLLAPPKNVLEKAGNKIRAREIAKQTRIGRFAHIPVLEGTEVLPSADEAIKAARHVGYPVMLKDADTGGGTGNRPARNDEELKDKFTELITQPGERQVYLERYIEHAIHVEVQIAADNFGNVVSLGERDCTLQRRQQKLVEESPSPNINDATRNILQTAAVNFAKIVGYRGVGTVEFVVDKDRRGHGWHGEQDWYFMEVNPRIQVEHPVTELQTSIDIVDLMLDIAEGKPLPFTQAAIKPQGHTREVRIYAEDPERNFQPASGSLTEFHYEDIEGVRVDKGYEEGDEIPEQFDKTICKVIAHADTREETLMKIDQFLDQMTIRGVPTNREFHIELQREKAVQENSVTTTFIESWWQKKLKDRVHEFGQFVNGGTLTLMTPSYALDVSQLPQDVRSFSRSEGRIVSYSEYLEIQKQKSGKDSAAEYGTIERDGVQFAFYHLDYSFLTGSFGIKEDRVFEDACKLAHEKRLPLVTICSSSGVRQQENTLGLSHMGISTSALNRYPPLFHVNIYTGNVYGGVPASFAGAADIQIAIDSEDTKIGFTGIEMVLRTMGKAPSSSVAKDVYKDLPDEDKDLHSPQRHARERNVHILPKSLSEASDTVTHLLHLLRSPSTVTDPHMFFHPRERIGLLPIEQQEHQQPRFHVPKWLGRFWEKHKDKPQEILTQEYEIPRPSQRLRIIEKEPDRPTAADFIDPRAGIFEDAMLLASYIPHLPPVIAAIARIDNEPVFILAHQTQKRTKDGKETKHYEMQKPQDWEFTQKMLDLAEKLRLPIILFGDTMGADPRPVAEDNNQSHKIAHVLLRLDAYPYPVISINIGMKGSGGGETFIRPMGAACDFENALSFVAHPRTQYRIMTGKWIDETSSPEARAELDAFVDSLADATAESRLNTYQIDAIIKEGKGGAHVDPRIPARHLREWLVPTVRELRGKTLHQLRVDHNHRIDRLKSVGIVESL